MNLLMALSPLIIFILILISFVINNSLKDDREVKTKELKKVNQLFRCSSCEKLSRTYQQNLYSISNDNSTTHYPHCERQKLNWSSSGLYCTLNEVTQEDKWMETHPDCPKLDHKQLKIIEKTIEQLKETKQDMEEQKRFEEYNNIKVDSKWINNLTKTMKKIQEENTL